MLIGYELTAEYCREHHLRGGVAIFLKDNIKENVEILNVYDFCIELVWSSQGEASLKIMFQVLESINTNKFVIIMGDINIESLEISFDYNIIKDLLNGHKILRLDLPPTRITTPLYVMSIDCICWKLISYWGSYAL